MRKSAILFVMTIAVAAAYRGGRAASSAPSFDDFPPYQGPRQHPPFHEQHQPFREYQSYKPRPFRQQQLPYRHQSSFRDQSLLREYSSFKDQPFYRDQSSFRDSSEVKGLRTPYADGTLFRDQQFRDQAPFKNQQSFQQQSFSGTYTFRPQEQSFETDLRSVTDSTPSNSDKPYDKPIDSYKDQDQLQRHSLSFGSHSDYLKYGNHGFGFASLPSISSFENPLPLNEETFTTTESPSIPTATHKPLLQSTASSPTTPSVTQVHTSANTETKMTSEKSSHMSTTAQPMRSNTLADAPTTASTQVVSTAPTVSMSTKESSNLAHSPTPKPTALPVMVTNTPILSFEGNTLAPIEFHTTKFASAISPTAFYLPSDLKNKMQHSMFNYLLPDETKDTVKSSIQNVALSYVLPQVPNSSLSSNMQGTALNYLLSDDSKSALKSSVQNSLLNYLLQQEPKRGLSFQQSSLPETLNYVPLATLVERPKFMLPSTPIPTLSAVSQPLHTINYVPATLPRLSFMGLDSSATSGLPLSAALRTGLPSSIPLGSLASSTSNSLPSGLTDGISAGIPGSMSGGISTSVPSLNFGQSFQHMGQVRQFEAPRNQPYATGLQLQLGGFGGIDYTLQSNNPGPRPMELGIAKVGLSLPEFQRPHIPTFAKVGFGQRMW